MPELPEVQTIVSTLAPRLVGRQIAAVELRRSDIVTPADADLVHSLLGRRITAVQRRAKRIVFLLDDAGCFYIHLGMSGRLTIETPGAPLRPHTHLILTVPGASPGEVLELRFQDPRRFGGIWWLGCNPMPEAHIGPEPLELPARDLAQRLGRTRRAIKAALLDQRLIAGLGNIYVDESLFAARIHPLTPANALGAVDIGRLSRSIKAVLRRAIRHRGSTLRDYVDAEGQAGDFQKIHRVYARQGCPCPRCRTPIQRLTVAARSTHFCPRCQEASAG